MKVRLNVQNEYVNFHEKELDFSCYGVYLISGDNGVGKTTILRSIILDNADISFETVAAERIYHKERQKLFSYIEQDPMPTPGNIKTYLYRCNPNVDKKKMREYLELFGLGDLNWKQKVELLSGGERIKLNIIAGLLKDTPYIFMDEPTNNMDNESVEALKKIVNEMKENHTFIIVSHDPRMSMKEATYIKIRKDDIIYENDHVGQSNLEICANIGKAKWKRMLLHLKDPFVLSSMLLMLSFLLFIGMLNNIVISGWYSNEEMPDCKNLICAYVADGVFGELNQTYAEGADIEVDQENYYNLLNYDNLEGIAKESSVTKIILSDEIYLNQIAEDYYGDLMLDSLHIASIPYDVIMEFGDCVNYCFDIRYLENGRLPYDNANEVAISEALLKKYFDFDNMEQVIGKSIEIDEKSYEIVGICYEDICVISYDGQGTYGFFELEKNSFSDKKEELKEYLISVDATNLNTPSYVLIYTKDGTEKKLLDKLVQQYSANNFYSYEYAKIFARQYNSVIKLLLLIGNLLGSILLSFLIVLVYRKGFTLYKSYMETLDYYYLKGNETRKIFVCARLIEFFVCIVAVVFWIRNISDYEALVYPYFSVSCVVFLISLLAMYKKGKKNVD